MLLTYQPANASDLDALFAFNKELIDQYEDLSHIPYQKVLAWVRQKLEQQIQEYTCIFADGKKAGYYHFSPMDSDTMELDDLYLFPAFRGHGIGTAVIQKCCTETSQPILLYVFQKNTSAIALYQRMGFQIQCNTQNVSRTRYIMRRG